MSQCQHNEIQIIPILESLQILDISDEEYFGEKYKEHISNSKLKLINPKEGGSPESYLQGLPFTASDAFYFGSAVHELVLQPESFKLVESVDRPTAKAGFMADELFTTYKKKGLVEFTDVVKASDKISYYKGKMDRDKYNALIQKILPYFEQRLSYENNNDHNGAIYLDVKSRDKLKSCLTNIKNHEGIQELLNPKGLMSKPTSCNEATILLDVKCVTPSKEEVVLHLKGKLDNYTLDWETGTITLNDLKTTGHLVEDFGKDSFYKYHYYRQMGMYGWLLHLANKAIYKIPDLTFKCNMLLVSSIPPCNCGIYKVTNSHIQKGVQEFSDLLKRVAHLELYGN